MGIQYACAEKTFGAGRIRVQAALCGIGLSLAHGSELTCRLTRHPTEERDYAISCS